MTTMNTPSFERPKELAEAGVAIATVANLEFDPERARRDVFQDSDFYTYRNIAGTLIGEGSEGSNYLEDQNLEDVDRSVQEAVLLGDAGDVSAYVLGLRPRINKDQVKQINARSHAAALLMHARFPVSRWKGYSDYGLFRSGDDLIVAQADDYGYSVDKLSDKPATAENTDLYTIEIDGEEYDCREGMTRGIYQAIRASRKKYDEIRVAQAKEVGQRPLPNESMRRLERGDAHGRYATLLTGEKTPRGGNWVAFFDGTFTPYDPANLVSSVTTNEGYVQLGFRPAVVLRGML